MADLPEMLGYRKTRGVLASVASCSNLIAEAILLRAADGLGFDSSLLNRTSSQRRLGFSGGSTLQEPLETPALAGVTSPTGWVER